VIPLAGYTYLGPLGKAGTFGTVYHARNDLSGLEVAIKHIDDVLTPDARASWEAEAHAMAACKHENLVSILHAEITPDGPALVMELLRDGSVAARFGDSPAPVRAVVDIGTEACWGLHRLHGEGLMHRDIKPANLLYDGDHVKLGDFGLAGKAGDPVDIVYQPHLPPEVQMGWAWTATGDVYALSATMWRLLWGDANNGRHDPDLPARIAARKWPHRDGWPPHVHKRLRTALRAALHPDPTKRPASAAELRSALETARPLVSWLPTGVGEWQGVGPDAEWTVTLGSSRFGSKVETKRNVGRGARRVPGGCAKQMDAEDASDLCRSVLQTLATAGIL
jgi:serine/threonine protein kinase